MYISQSLPGLRPGTSRNASPETGPNLKPLAGFMNQLNASAKKGEESENVMPTLRRGEPAIRLDSTAL